MKKLILLVLLLAVVPAQAKQPIPSEGITLTKQDMVQLENAMNELVKERDQAKELASYYHDQYHDLANCSITSAKAGYPAMSCLGDLSL